MIRPTHNPDLAITMVVELAAVYAVARRTEAELEDERPIVKLEAIKRIMQSDNPLNGKPHSASSAETQVETDEAYAAHRKAQREATLATIMAKAQYESAKFTAQLAVTLAGAEA